MANEPRGYFLPAAAVFALLSWPGAALAAVPAEYQGKPFDPAVAGGDGIIPPSVKAGPIAIPGRIDFVNYDLGGEGIAFHSEAHYTTKGGDGYRDDRPTATMCLTATSKPDLWYDTSAALDGKAYPADGAADFYIGSIHPNDWFNYTVDVKTAGKYQLSASFSTGNGPPGGEGGDGEMELIIFVNGTQQADWKTTFPDYQNKANFHNWKAYPNFAELTLEAGPAVIKFQAPFKHLNLDYVDVALEGGDSGGAGGAGGSANGGSGGAAAGTETGGAGASSAAGTATSAGTATGGASSGGTPEVGGTSAAGTTASGGSSSGGSAATTPTENAGCSCRAATASTSGYKVLSALLAGLLLWRRRRPRRPRQPDASFSIQQ